MTVASGTAEGVAHDDEVEVSIESGVVVAPLVVAHDREEVKTSPNVAQDAEIEEEKPSGWMKKLRSFGAGPTDKEKSKEEKPLASVKEVFSFGTGPKKISCLVLGFFCAIVSGAVFPALAFLWAESFKDLGASTSNDDFLNNIKELVFSLMILGVIAFVFFSAEAALMEAAADEMTHSLKTQWFDALLRQDMAYYDIKEVNATATIISTSGAKYKKGLGRKLGASLQFTVTFFGGLAYGFWASWQVSLLLLATLPLMAGTTLFLIQVTQTQSARASAGYAEAGSIVQVTVSSIRTILSLNGVEATIDKFVAGTQKAYDECVKLLRTIGMANGMLMSSMILGYLVLVLYGAYLLYDQVRTTGCDPSGTVPNATACNPEASGVFGAMMGITIAASVLAQVSVGLEAFSDARAACYPAIQVINRRVSNEKTSEEPTGPSRRASTRRASLAPLPKYVIDSSSEDGAKLPSVNGTIEFKNVTFAYPTRQETNVLEGFSLTVEAGKTVALVGPSGCGKSTTVQLVERFYDPVGGEVTLDGHDLRDLNVHWLRQQIGLVSQEPALFACSIRENIAYGSPNATQEQIEEAAKKANAHSFVVSFPDGYNTQVGYKGAQLSGGQKQRIALARVLVKNPQILLLDEATSALDSESEKVVQEALDNLLAEKKQTTIVIAHRLSTIRNADMIAVVEDGKIVETGTHSELIALQGSYHKLVEAQTSKPSEAERRDASEPPSRSESFVDAEALNEKAGIPALLFKDVHFRYPARPDVEVFRGLNLSVHSGETLALVGPSGHGKSTVIQLIERFYDPDSGSIELDGIDLKDLNVRFLRGQLGLVGQEPVLFDTTIAENIRFGLPDATQEQIESAAKQANAHSFINSFPDGYNTMVGEGGTQVSGGQKQRIALARALVRKPRILLLDEATSALDSESERVVQETLDKIMASDSQTTIVIAHRLSTIRNADRIAVISSGKVWEIGTHDELMLKNGLYRRLHAFQSLDESERLSLSMKPGESLYESVVLDASRKEAAQVSEVTEIDKETEKRNAKRARLLAKGDGKLFAIGGVGAILSGLTFPAWGILFAYVIDVLYRPVWCDPDSSLVSCEDFYDNMAEDMRQLSFKVAYGCVGVMVSTVIGNMLTFHGFGTASERVNKRVRDAAFDSLVRQEVGYFDLRPVGTITSQLEDDAALLHSFSGEPIRTLIMSLASVLVGVVIAFIFMWPFALLTLALIPVMTFGALMEMKIYMGEDKEHTGDEDHNSPGGIVVETLVNIRTVSSLTIEKVRSTEYSEALRNEDPTPNRTNFLKGVATGVGQIIQLWGIALMFWWGGWLLLNYQTTFSYQDFLISMFSLLFSLSGLGIAAQGATNRDKAKLAAHRIFELTDRASAIDPISEEGKKNV